MKVLCEFKLSNAALNYYPGLLLSKNLEVNAE